MQHLDRLIDNFILWLSNLAVLINRAVFRLVMWRTRNEDFEEEIDPLDLPEPPDSSRISLRAVDLGEFSIDCPECGDEDHLLLMGLGLTQEDSEGEHVDISTVGMIVYSCGDIIYSPCLTDKVAGILNACDNGTLRPEMFTHLIECEEHGVLYTEE